MTTKSSWFAGIGDVSVPWERRCSRSRSACLMGTNWHYVLPEDEQTSLVAMAECPASTVWSTGSIGCCCETLVFILVHINYDLNDKCIQ